MPSAAWALRWYFSTRMSWGSARGLALDPEHEGSGRPNRGLDDPKRRLFAVLAGAIKAAEADDQQRNPARPAPFMRWQRVRASPQRIEDQDTGWLCQHFGTGRAYTWIAESEGWTELEVSTRVERALRVVRDRLREGGWLEGGDGG